MVGGNRYTVGVQQLLGPHNLGWLNEPAVAERLFVDVWIRYSGGCCVGHAWLRGIYAFVSGSFGQCSVPVSAVMLRSVAGYTNGMGSTPPEPSRTPFLTKMTCVEMSMQILIPDLLLPCWSVKVVGHQRILCCVFFPAKGESFS